MKDSRLIPFSFVLNIYLITVLLFVYCNIV